MIDQGRWNTSVSFYHGRYSVLHPEMVCGLDDRGTGTLRVRGLDTLDLKTINLRGVSYHKTISSDIPDTISVKTG